MFEIHCKSCEQTLISGPLSNVSSTARETKQFDLFCFILPLFRPIPTNSFFFRVVIFLLIIFSYYSLIISASNSYVFLWITVRLLPYDNKFLLMLNFANRRIFDILWELIFGIIMKDFLFKLRANFTI